MSFAQQFLAILQAAKDKLEAEGSALADTVKQRIEVLEPMIASDAEQAEAAAHQMFAQLVAAAEGK
jgi:hypothetical protein